MTEHGVDQNTQMAQSLLVSKDECELRRDILSHHMATIVKVARALRGTIPGIGVMHMPKGNATTARIVTAATTMARQAEIYETVLVEHGLPQDFIAQLDKAAVALKGSLDARGEARAVRVGATRGIDSELSLGRRVVDIMDASFTRHLRRQPAKLAEWRNVKRVQVKGTSVRDLTAALQSSSTVGATSSTQPNTSSTSAAASSTEKEKAA